MQAVRAAESDQSTNKQQMFVAAAVITLGLCAVASVATLHEAPQEDSISNVFTGYKQFALRQYTTKLIMGPGQEADDMKAIQAAWITLKTARTRRCWRS